MGNLENLIVILKTTEKCNLSCKYCYFFNGQYDHHKFHPSSISRDIITKIGNFLIEACRDFNLKFIRFSFHGGEPLLQKQEEFDWMCNFFKEKLSSHVEISFAVQTNATLITENWINLFAKHEVKVGVSLDGPKEYNDENRIYYNGKGSYDNIKKGILNLQKAVKLGHIDKIGVLCVINTRRNAKKIYRHFVDDLKLKKMDFILPDYTWDTFQNQSAEKYGFFLNEVFDEWINDNNPQIVVRILEAVIRNIGGTSSSLLGVGPEVSNLKVITIASNGDISPEETLAHVNPNKFMNIANVKNITLKNFLNLSVIKKIEIEKSQKPKVCKKCCWENVCKGGADHHRYSDRNGFSNHSVMCKGLKKIYSKIALHLIQNGFSINKLSQTLFDSTDALTINRIK